MTQEEIIEMARQALKQEPREDWNSTAWVFADETLQAFAKLVAEEALAKEKALQDLHDENERLGLYKDAYAEQEPVAWQEPLAWISTGPASMIHWTADKPAYGDDWVPLYTTPPQREFVGLTKEEIAEFDTWHDNREEEVGWCNPSEIVAYIEAKLKDKNT